MKVCVLNGSPKKKNSTSTYLLDALQKKLGEENEYSRYDAGDAEEWAIAEQIKTSDVLLLAFPLYVDSIPSHMLRCLEKLESVLNEEGNDVRVYAIVNCGFYDAVQNHIAIEMLKVWCEKSHLQWGRAVAAGGGGMAQAAPVGYGPSANMGKTLDQLALDIRDGKIDEILYTEPNFPRFLYKFMAHIGWRQSARKNGLSRKALHQQCSLDET